VAPRRLRPPTYDEEVLVALRKVVGCDGLPAGKRMAPFLGEITDRLRAGGELDVSGEVAAKLGAMSAATIDRRLAGERARLQLRGRSGTKPGTLLKVSDPDPDLGGLGPTAARVRGDRMRRPRGRRPLR